MAAVSIPCPQCGASLKLPNRKLLGRKGKCPKCEHRFVLTEPDEVELQLAEPEVPAAGTAPLVGTSAKWVPDEPTASPEIQAAAPELPPVAPPLDFGSPAPAIDVAAVSAPAEAAVAPVVATEVESVSTRVRSRRRKKPTGPVLVGIGTALLVVIAFGVWQQYGSQSPEAANSKPAPAVNQEWQEEKAAMAVANQEVQNLSPTDGDQIPLNYMPFTPHLVFHLRPAELWNSDHEEFRVMLFELGRWLESSIPSVTHFEPQEIEELTFAVNFGPRTAPPEVAAVVRLTQPQTESDLFRRFNGRLRTDLPENVYESDEFSYMKIDQQTFAVAPVTLSDALADSKEYPRQVSVDLEPLVRESDRKRHLTLLFDVKNIDIHREYIFVEQMQHFADRFLMWFGKDVQTVSWSLHLEPNLFMETLLHQSNESSALRVERSIKSRLEDLPGDLTAAVQYMNPGTVGSRQLIGRFPAMSKALTLGTSTNVGPDYVRLVTLLPAKAAPNLAAATLLTWNQSIVTDFSQEPAVVAADPQVPQTIAERLQMPVLVDFRRMPLQEAFAFIGDEIKTTIDIDGDGLKLAGFTQNMAQTFNLGEVAAIKAIDAIVSQYEGKMVISVDEANKKITVTTLEAANAKGMTVYDTKQ
jgi:hypothetical protein